MQTYTLNGVAHYRDREEEEPTALCGVSLERGRRLRTNDPGFRFCRACLQVAEDIRRQKRFKPAVEPFRAKGVPAPRAVKPLAGQQPLF